MQNSSYVMERHLPRIIQSICAQRGIDYQAFSDDWVLRLQYGNMLRWVVGYKFDANRSGAGQLADDKVATYAALTAAGVSAVQHYLVRAVPHDPHEWQYSGDGLDEAREVVIKPLDGHGGRAVTLHQSPSAALQTMRQSGEPAWAISPYYDLRAEYRLIMLGDTLLLSFEKTQPTLRGKLKMFNLGYGAVATEITNAILLEQLNAMATKVMQAMGLGAASVDIVRTAAGDLRVLEVNDGIMLEHYLQQGPEFENRAVGVYDAVIGAMFA